MIKLYLDEKIPAPIPRSPFYGDNSNGTVGVDYLHGYKGGGDILNMR